MSMVVMILGWVCVLALGALLGKLVSKLRLPAILGWLLAGMIFGPFGFKLMSQSLMARSPTRCSRWQCWTTKYLGFTLLPHSGVSLVFTGIACATLAGYPELVQILRGTIAAAAAINEIIAVIAAREGFRLAGEIRK